MILSFPAFSIHLYAVGVLLHINGSNTNHANMRSHCCSDKEVFVKNNWVGNSIIIGLLIGKQNTSHCGKSDWNFCCYSSRTHYLCSIEVRAIVVAVQLQQPLSECTAIYAMYIVERRPPPCAVIIHESCTDQQWNRFQDCARIQDSKVNVLAAHQTLWS